MVGSPGEKAGVYAGAGEAGRRIEAALREASAPDAPARSASAAPPTTRSFAAAGIPVGGIFTGSTAATTGPATGSATWTPRWRRPNARATADALVALAAR